MNSLTASRHSSAEVLNTFISMTLWLMVIPHGNVFWELRTDFELKKDYELKKTQTFSKIVSCIWTHSYRVPLQIWHLLHTYTSWVNPKQLRVTFQQRVSIFLNLGLFEDPTFFQHRPKNHTHVSHTPKSKIHPVKKKSGLTWSYLLLSMIFIALL